MKYKLINLETKEEYLCEKVTVDGFDYYVSDEKPNLSQTCYSIRGVIGKFGEFENCYLTECFKVIATNNPNIDIPKVVDEVNVIEEMACKIANVSLNWYKDKNNKNRDESIIFHVDGIIEGYNKSQETHPFSEEDIVEFLNWISKDGYPCIQEKNKGLWVLHPLEPKNFTPKELLQLWKEQQTKTIYYE